MTGHEALLQAAETAARQAAAELEELVGGGALRENVKTARELCAMLRDLGALRRELESEQGGQCLTVRFEGDAERAAN